MLKGKAKKDYQREYMRKLRLKGKMLDPSVRPIYDFNGSPNIPGALEGFRTLTPTLDADGNPIYEE